MKKYVVVCDGCQKDFDEKEGARLIISWFELRREPNVEADICANCRKDIINFIDLRSSVIDTNTGKANFHRMEFIDIKPEAPKNNEPKASELATEQIPPKPNPNTDDLLPDEKRDPKEILRKMDEAARRSRGRKSPSEILAEKFENGGTRTALDSENCAHTEQVPIDKSKGITQCLECGRSLVYGKEIS